ncbi:AAA family ATPase [Segnochrobactraceae bacterium EtOH-i3]
MPLRRILLSGCSGGGKSTLLAELQARGAVGVPEPGRRIVETELASGGSALPWRDLAAFLHRAFALARADWDAAAHLSGPVFFDRGLIDAASALADLTGDGRFLTACRARPYHPTVFLAPPWPDIYATDPGRQHGLDDAIAEYERLAVLFPALGYDVVLLPKCSVRERADFVLATLADAAPET